MQDISINAKQTQAKQRTTNENITSRTKNKKQKRRTSFSDLGGVELKAPRRARGSFLDRFDPFDQFGSFCDPFSQNPRFSAQSSSTNPQNSNIYHKKILIFLIFHIEPPRKIVQILRRKNKNHYYAQSFIKKSKTSWQKKRKANVVVEKKMIKMQSKMRIKTQPKTLATRVMRSLLFRILTIRFLSS
ncbi:hypothetical protein RCS94_01815 [Orbaceae bacterium ac157xtp]